MHRLVNILAVTVIAMLASGCVKDIKEDVPPQDITFEVANYSVATKTQLSGEVYDTNIPFGAYAFSNVATGQYDPYMTNQKVYFDTDRTLWATYGKKYYWPLQNRLTFISYSPYSENDPFITSATYETAEAKDKSIKTGDEDWMYSDIAADYNSNVDAVTDGSHNYTGVPTLFHHALCKVSVSAKATTLSDGATTVTTTINAVQKTPSSDTPTDISDDTETDLITGQKTRTIIKTREKVTNASQSTVVTTTGAKTFEIYILEAKLKDMVAKATLSLTAKPGHTVGTPEVVGWDKPSTSDPVSWVPSDGTTEDVSMTALASNEALTLDNKDRMYTRSFLPQNFNAQQLYLKYSIKTYADRVSITTVTHWTITETYRITQIIISDINGNIKSDTTTQELTSTSESTKISDAPVTTSSTEPTVVTFEKDVALYGLGGLNAWGMNKEISYCVSIAPTGKRIDWDPAQVKNWGSTGTGNITF